jgi:hypothetical protein
MIKGLASIGKYAVVSAGNTSVPYINQNVSNPMQGMIRVWGTDIQVFDGTNWIVMNTSYALVGLTPDAESLLDWARQKRQEELELVALAESNTAIKDLLDTIKQKQDQLEMVKVLIKKEVTVGTR